ncbi:MAG TPA: hypothetical protein DEP45_13635, partial [Armatimonadetes bacterium]|nr:hypothetical protein [Armatimonadota bacterium]
MNPRWFFASRWRRTWFALGIMVLLTTAAISARWLAVERHRQALMEADYPSPPPGMVLVPAGYFWIGSNLPDTDADVPPLQRVFLPAFYIGKHEVTNAELAKVFPEHKY